MVSTSIAPAPTLYRRVCGFYVDKKLWREVAEFFPQDAKIEIDGQGAFLGRSYIVEHLTWL